MKDYYPEIRDWLLRRIDEPLCSVPGWNMDDFASLLPHIGFGRQTRQTTAVLRFMVEYHNQIPPVVYCVVGGRRDALKQLNCMVGRGEITPEQRDEAFEYVVDPCDMVKFISRQIIPPSIVIIDEGLKFNYDAFRGHRIESPIVRIGN